jgi:hypothetical protein
MAWLIQENRRGFLGEIWRREAADVQVRRRGLAIWMELKRPKSNQGLGCWVLESKGLPAATGLFSSLVEHCPDPGVKGIV